MLCFSKISKLILCLLALALFNTNSFASEDANFMTKKITNVGECEIINSDLVNLKIEFSNTNFDFLKGSSNQNSTKLGYWDAMKLVDINIQTRHESQILNFESTSKQNAIYYCSDVRKKILEQGF